MPEQVNFHVYIPNRPEARLRPKPPTLSRVIEIIRNRSLHPDIEARLIERAKRWPSGTLHIFLSNLTNHINEAAAFMNMKAKSNK
jgi:hypothetical protein